MSGNYDFPPASDRPRSSSATGRQLRLLEHLRAFLAERASPTTRGFESLIQEVEQSQLDRTRNQSTLEREQQEQSLGNTATSGNSTNQAPRGPAPRRSQHRERHRNADGNPSENMDQGSDASSNRSRIRWLRPSETPSSRIGPYNATAHNEVVPASFDEIEAGIREANAFRAASASASTSAFAFGEGLPRSESPLALSPYPEAPRHPPSWDEPRHHRSGSPGTLEHRWRAKRRKLDSDDNREGPRGFSYGHYGQVVPGLLKMEIASCDGGSYYDDNGESSWPGNVLLDDSSVYCTKKSCCNLILKHRGDAPFSLKRIVIRAPKKGFDAAIQEGMVFISMTSEGLLERTSQYQIHYTSRSRRNHRSRRQYPQPSQEYMNAYRTPLQAITPAGEQNEAQQQARLAPPPSNIEPQFRVTTENEDNSDDGPHDDQENNRNTNNQRPVLYIFNDDGELICPEEGVPTTTANNDNNESDNDNDDDDDDDDNDNNNNNNDNDNDSDSDIPLNSFANWQRAMVRQSRRQERRQHHRYRLAAPSRIEPGGRMPMTTTAGSSSTTEVMKPHARFFIERDKSMVNIKFDPPPSGRFVLVKLWSPYNGGNIDIESIMLHGYAGTRYFASLEPR